MLAAVALAAGGTALGLDLSSTGKPAATYGALPSWLPRPTVRVGRVVVASAAHPWRAIQGDTVVVELPRGRVRATVAGPAVPEEGDFPIPATTRCTFSVVLAARSGIVPLTSTAFTVLDENGRLHHPQVKVDGGGALPARLRAGRSLILTAVAMLPPGSGLFRWTPSGGKPVVSWDFDVEID